MLDVSQHALCSIMKLPGLTLSSRPDHLCFTLLTHQTKRPLHDSLETRVEGELFSAPRRSYFPSPGSFCWLENTINYFVILSLENRKKVAFNREKSEGSLIEDANQLPAVGKARG